MAKHQAEVDRLAKEKAAQAAAATKQQQEQQPLQQQLEQSQQLSQGALEQQAQFGQEAAGMGGYQNLTDVYAQQAALADQLRAMASGQGPNPAVEQLRQQTQQNIEGQKALMAGQRGAGANVGAMQRRMAQQAAGAGQQATSQEAVLRSQQQIAAMNALQQQQDLMAGMASGQAGMQQQALANLLGGTQGLQGLSQDQLQALISNQMAQRGLGMQQTLGEAGINLNQAQSERQFMTDIAVGGLGGLSSFGSGYFKSRQPSNAFSNLGSTGSTDIYQHTNQMGSGFSPFGGQSNKYNPYDLAEGGEVKGYAEGGPVAADSSNQSAALKEHYDEDMHHYAGGGNVEIGGKNYSTAPPPNVVDPTGSQSALLRAMQAAQGSQAAIGGQQDIVNRAAAMGGMRNMADVYAQQQALAGQLGELAAGRGPNPALEQLRQASGQGIESQAAMMAGQRGMSPNVALAASQIGRQGSAAQQQMAAQAAGQMAEQQMQGVGGLQRQQAGMGKLAGAQAGLQAGAAETLMRGTQGLQGLSQRQLALAYENELTQKKQDMEYNLKLREMRAKQEAADRNFWGNLIGGVVKGIGDVASAAVGLLAEGGEVKRYAEGGNVSGMDQKEALDRHYEETAPMSDITRMFLSGSTAPRMAQGGMAHDMRAGGHVPGQAPVGGAVDSYKNDIVDAKLSPGEIVLPRSVTQSSNPVEAAAKFVAAIKSKKGK